MNSIFNQTYKHLEVIIIYDDPKGNDLNFLKSFKNNKIKIKLIVNKKNLGAGKSRNIGIKESKGRYIAFLDADDYWERNKIKHQLEIMKKKKLLFTHTNYFLINENDEKIGLMEVIKNLKYNELIKSCDIGTSTVMVKKNILKNIFFPHFKTKEDYYLWLLIAKKKIKIYGINKNLVYWRKTDNSLSSSFFQKIVDAQRVYYLQNKSVIFSCYCVIRLSFFYILKKIKQKKSPQ
jgi:teichuronic acid biosynthesis glycosyltransferase TuaG